MNKKVLIGIIVFLSTILLTSGGYFGFTKFIDYKNAKSVKEINAILDQIESKEVCEKVFAFNEKDAEDNNKFRKDKFYIYKQNCDKKYNIKNIETSLENCKDIIKSTVGDFSDNYILLDSFKTIQKECSEKYLKITFGTGSFFNVNNDFKSSINLNFSLPFFTDIGKLGSDEYIENRTDAKKRLISLLKVSPSIDIAVDDIVLYPKKGIINLNLKPLTQYRISLKAFKSEKSDLETKEEVFSFMTPENKFLGIQIQNPLSLYMDTTPPEFEIVKYNLEDKKGTTLKICRIDNENYAKIEILRGRKEAKKEMEDFFLNGIDDLATYDCKEKVIDLTPPSQPSPLQEEGVEQGDVAILSPEKGDKILVRKKINFDEEIGKVARSGLYYVTFVDKEDRNVNNNLQFPVFFGIIDSHITMKISKNGEGYFFVNDFEGKPLANQEIRIYVNQFVDHKTQWNRKTKKEETQYFSPLEKSVLGKEIFLGKTNTDGILQVDLQNKVERVFEKTFSAEWNYKYSGINESFFVTSASEDNLTYNHSHWNAGIAPWNFGYKINSGWYYNDETDSSTPSLSSWGSVEKEYYSHVYTDRVLYLPGEEVNIKAVLRKSADLSIPKDKEFDLVIKDSKQKEILNSKLILSEYGSLSEKLKLTKNSPLGSYSIILKDKNGEYGRGYFSVEVFKNPKFKNDVSLETIGLNGEDVKIESTKNDTTYSWRTNHIGKFTIRARVDSKYYSGGVPENASYTYKVYKQYYYDNSYWDDCYWGCFWEPEKKFYTEGKGNLDQYGKANFNIDIAFESSYEDYKYIVEVTVTDKAGDTITGSNSITAKLPTHLKRWNSNADLKFQTDNNYYKQGEQVVLKGGLSHGKWTEDYNNKYLLLIKKKNYKTNYIDDVRGYKRPINVVEEKLDKTLLVNSSNFRVTQDGKLEFDFIPTETGEYVFEYGKINPDVLFNIKDVVKYFSENKQSKKYISTFSGEVLQNSSEYRKLKKYCSGDATLCGDEPILKKIGCFKTIKNNTNGNKSTRVGFDYDKCRSGKKINIEMQLEYGLEDILDYSKKYFTILSYGDTDAQNPIKSDNKIRVLSEKISYKLGERARVLVRLPFSKGKILWTIEKQGVVKKEYIDVNSNMFFKEVLVDDTFIPNAYIGVVAIETGSGTKIPEYKVGYTEIVVDKSDKKSFITIKPNKKVYKPREKVVLDINNTLANKYGKQAELTVMVVDDSLISLMGNVDLNTLEKFYKKLPFQIQTSLTNLAMLKNYYFSRPGIVGGSGFGNFKGGDSAVSSRTVFKNTAYYNSSVITNQWGAARVEFTLPDNLTNFRVMVVANSQDNFFGFSSESIEVRKNVVIEDKTPLIYRQGDKTEIGAQIFNHTDKEIGFKVQFKSEDIQVNKPEKVVVVGSKSSEFVTFWTSGTIDKDGDIDYKILALGDSVDNSDILERTIENKQFPSIISVYSTGGIAELQVKQNFKIDVPENTDIEKSVVKISFSNNLLQGIEKTVKSLLVYPYGCIEQTMSSTYPNAVILQFSSLLPGIIPQEEAQKNLTAGIERITSMQLANGGFGYWQGDTQANLHITPYVLRRIVDMKNFGAEIPNSMIENAKKYLEKNFSNITLNIDKAETFYSFAKLGEGQKAYDALLQNTDKTKFSRHELIAYTYGLITWDKVKYKAEIDKNILAIISKLDKVEDNYRYWSARSDKALFTSMLIDYNYSQNVVTEYIQELYAIDWSSYYYSTTAKNNSFIAFAKYMQKYGRNTGSNFAFSIGAIHNRDKRFYLGEEQPNTITREFKLKDIIQYKENHIELTTYILSGKSIFTNLTLEVQPKDKLKINKVSNRMKVEREVFEVLDINKADECSTIAYWRKQKANCGSILKKVEDNIYTKGKYYKIGIKVSFDKDRERRNVSLEDYIPSTFKIINSKFQTESSAVKSGNNKSWSWDHVEYLKDRVFANAGNTWGQDLYFEYMVTPEFIGEFTYPPVNAYMMYDGDTRAHSKFERIDVR